MPDKIFLIQSDDSLVTVNESAFASEDIFQDLLAKYPDLLAGDQVRPGEPRRWLLVTREKGVPDSEEGNARWSLDHLYLDQDGVPTLVEVKRSTDTRLRREVVGQMLDYAANAILYWAPTEVRHEFERRCEREGLDPEEEIARFLDDDELDEAWFWEQVKTNLQARKIRMLFVADNVPSELARIIEFLNEQMDPAEVLGLQLRYHEDESSGVRVLVPEIVGRTEAAATRKSTGPRPSRKWDRASILDEIESRGSRSVRLLIDDFLTWAEKLSDRFEFGKGATVGSCWPVIDRKEQEGNFRYKLFSLWSSLDLNIDLTYLKNGEVFADEEMYRQLQDRATALPGAKLPGAGHYVDISLNEPDADERIASIKSLISWMAAQIVRSGASTEGDRA